MQKCTSRSSMAASRGPRGDGEEGASKFLLCFFLNFPFSRIGLASAAFDCLFCLSLLSTASCPSFPPNFGIIHTFSWRRGREKERKRKRAFLPAALILEATLFNILPRTVLDFKGYNFLFLFIFSESYLNFDSQLPTTHHLQVGAGNDINRTRELSPHRAFGCRGGATNHHKMSQSLAEIFMELGISQYLDAFVDQGFDTWDTILDITESDL